MDYVIYTDLDGCLLDRNYSWKAAGNALELLKELEIPLVFVTSKTSHEVLFYHEQMGIRQPFIIENGGAIYVPSGYFRKDEGYELPFGYHVIPIARPYSDVRKVLSQVKEECTCSITGFGDMSDEELMTATGLPVELMALAKKREYDEPVIMEGSKEEIQCAVDMIKASGLNCVKGTRFYHVSGSPGKGYSVGILSDSFRELYSDAIFVGFGDSENDLSLLEIVDIPVIVGDDLNAPPDARITRPGPEGWADAVRDIFS